MTAVDTLHNGLCTDDIRERFAVEIGKKILLKRSFVLSVVPEGIFKKVVVGSSEGICRIMDQLAQCIIVDQA